MSALSPELRVTRPFDVASAIEARRQHPDSRFIAGGTDLLVGMRHGLYETDLLIDISHLDELAEVEINGGGTRIGASATVASLASLPAIARRYRAIHDAAEAIAGPGHRAMGTVGGNLCLDTRCIYYNQSEWWRRANGYCLKRGGDTCHVAPQGNRCHAAFTGDLAPALLVLGATVEIAGASGRRRIPLGELYREEGRTHLTLAEDEILVAVHLPRDCAPSAYAKVRVRGAIDYPLAGVAVALKVADELVASLQIGVTGTNSRPFLINGTAALIGKPLDDRALEQIERLVQKQVQPMRTTLVSAHYRRLAAAAMARRLTRTLCNEANTVAAAT